MLERYDSQQITTLLESLPCKVELPAAWSDFFSRHGLLPSIPEDLRQYPRKHMPGRALLELTRALPTVPRGEGVYSIYTRDISRISVSFVHAQQLYPGEAGKIWLAGGSLEFEVVRCQRIKPQCYVHGAMLTAIQL